MNKTEAIQAIAIHYGVADSPIDGKGFYKKKVKYRTDEKTASAGLHSQTGHINDFGGSTHYFWDICKDLNIDYTEDDRREMPSTKRDYISLKDYAESHALTIEQCAEYGVTWDDNNGKPLLKIETKAGVRNKKMYGDHSWFTETGFKNHWYRGSEAVQIAKDNHLDYIVIVNAEISTIACQIRGIPATTTTTGEGGIKALIPELRKHWAGKIYLCLDCDDTGRNASEAIHRSDPNTVIIDLMLGTHNDAADFCLLHGDSSKNALEALFKTQAKVIELTGHETAINRGDNVRAELMQMMLGKMPVIERYITMPIKALHKFGGLCEQLTTGHLTLIGGDTGTGKTMLLEIMADELNIDGENVLMWCPEWTKFAMETRRIIRNSLDYLASDGKHYQLYNNQVRNHLKFLGEAQDGVPKNERKGRTLTQQQFNVFTDSSKLIDMWKGQTEYFLMKHSLEETFEDMRVTIVRERAKGKIVRVIFFDYAQLVQAKSPDPAVNRYEFIIDELKRFAIQENVHVIVTTQVTKSAGADRKNGYMLGEHDALWVRGDKANLFLTINPVFCDGVKTLFSWLNVAKTSEGGAPVNYIDEYLRIPVTMIPTRFTFQTSENGKAKDGTPLNWNINPAWSHLHVQQYKGTPKSYVDKTQDVLNEIEDVFN